MENMDREEKRPSKGIKWGGLLITCLVPAVFSAYMLYLFSSDFSSFLAWFVIFLFIACVCLIIYALADNKAMKPTALLLSIMSAMTSVLGLCAGYVKTWVS